ncbi:MAG: hypothetical protein KAT16_02500 [Candidatus Heimdallarchaeota archaeon]|nr:hypothetical protein [Candidatus Heimdallarchaeota archaeon]
MSISEFPNVIENSLLQSDADITLTDYTTIQIRGSNFKNNKAIIFADNLHSRWLWKSTNTSTLIKEFLASYIASQLEVPVPRVLIAKKGTKIGLLHEWLGTEAIELKDLPPKDLNRFQLEDIIDLLLLEALLGAIDRHGGNYLYSQSKIWGIDFENSFSSDELDSELCLYFSFNNLKDSGVLINKQLKTFIDMIKTKNIVNNKDPILKMIDKLPLDPRAITNMKNQVKDIYNALQANLLILDELLHNYFQRKTHHF